jgi:hypothetical protein
LAKVGREKLLEVDVSQENTVFIWQRVEFLSFGLKESTELETYEEI